MKKEISIKQFNHLQAIRDTQSLKIKDTLKRAYNELIQAKTIPTRYKLHKKTKVAYITINKYFFELNNNYDEVING